MQKRTKHSVSSPYKYSSTGRALLRLLGLSAATLSSAHAADVYWDINAGTTGAGGAAPAGTWSTSAANWSLDSIGASGTTAWTNGDNAIFSAGTDATGTFTITMTNVTVGNLTQEEGRIRLNNGGTITLASASNSMATGTRVSGDYDIRVDAVIADSSSGASSITKTGPGILMLTGTNTYTGGFTLNGGTATIEGNGAVFGSGALTMNAGSFTKSWGNGTNSVTVPNSINVTGSVNVGIVQGNGGNLILSGDWSAGNSSSAFNVPNTAFNGLAILSSTINVSGNVSAYTGTIAHNTLATGGNRLRFGPNNGGSIIYDASKARFLTSGATTGANCLDLADGAYGTFKMGELGGAGGVVRGGWATAGNTTFEIGALGTNSKFGGALLDNINGAGGRTALTKVGPGSLELSLAGGNTYSNGTSVSEGTLLVSNISGSATGSGPVSVSSAGSLGGSGRIAPTAANGISVLGTIAPGGSVSAVTGGTLESGIGAITFDFGATTGKLDMLGGVGFRFELGVANPSLGSISGGSSDLLTIANASAGDVAFDATMFNFLGTGQVGFYKLLDTSFDGTTWSNLTFDGTTGVVTSGLIASNFGPGLTGEFVVGTAENGADSVGDIYVHVVPEPSASLVLLAGIGALAVVRRRREV